MPTALEEAAQSLVPDVRREADWFAEPGHKQFIDPVSLGIISMGLIKVFATAAATAAGTAAGKALVDYVRDLIAGRATADPKDVDSEVAASRVKLAALAPAEAADRLSSAEGAVADQCAQVMPRARAITLAGRIRAASAALLQ